MTKMLDGIGASATRREDSRLVRGAGRYTDDLAAEGDLVGLFIRSEVAHGRILSATLDDARAVPGVVAILTGEDAAADGLGTLKTTAPVTNRDGTSMIEAYRPILPRTHVHHVGQPLALIVAESMAAARDAADLVWFEIEDLGAVTEAGTESPALHDAAPGNMIFDWGTGDWEGTADAIATAPHTVSVRLRTQRICGAALEGRAVVARPDPANDRIELTSACQGVHLLHHQIARNALHWPKEKLRVVAHDVGGGFGPKFFAYPEQAAVVWAASKLQRPVRWTSSRTESFVSETHARPQVTHATLGFDDEGRFLALQVDALADLGAFLSTFGPGNPTDSLAKVASGMYALPRIAIRSRAFYTSTVPIDAYRGAGKPPMVVTLERLVDKAGLALGLAPEEIRRRNLVQPDAMPWQTPLGMSYDGGDYPAILDAALERLDWQGFEGRRAESAARGLLRGRGIACNMHPVGGATNETSTVTVNGATGRIEAWTGTQSTGQGHETIFAQILADRLGIPATAIDVRQGDTERLVRGGGTGGSSSTIISGATLTRTADEVIRIGRQRAADRLETAVEDIEFLEGTFRVTGTDRQVSLFDLAEEDPLAATQEFADSVAAFPHGVVIAEVEIDPDTGKVSLDRLGAVDDAGTIINPTLLAGQSQGALAQGVGAILLEHAVYDPDSGQLLSGSLMDYCMPRADDLPGLDVNFHETTSSTNILGARGIGEMGSNGAPAAITNAVHDVLQRQGITMDLDPPFTPAQVWRALNAL
ncbi:MAG: xanthine dehydrogenase family protein molybdopterin-binding subunit [Minwuia sp.]|nr:xanthine dehydrogenase family protein molybdopterin-binding subunit [Minwuia sp.]